MKSNRSKKLHGNWRNNDVESLVESFRLNDLSEVESFFLPQLESFQHFVATV